MDISILVAGVVSMDSDVLPSPLKQLLLQAVEYPQVEVLSFLDNGKVSLGSKRNHLMAACHGRYLAFVDGGSVVAPDFLSSLASSLDYAASAPDVVVYDHLLNSKAGEVLCSFGLEYDLWESSENGKRCLKPRHSALWRAELAKRHFFPDVNSDPEFFWSQKVIQEARSQIRIDVPLYFPAD